MLDHRHVRLPNQSKHDENNYTLGSIAGHNIAIACLPEYGTNKAAIAAKSMQATFPNIRFGLLVGVGGGVPGPITDTGPANDIRLGDVVVSLPAGQGGGVVQYDLIRREVDGFRRVGVLNKPPTLLRTAVASLRAERRLGRQLTGLIEEAFVPDDESCEDQNGDDEADRWTYPGTERDVLFRPGYKHHCGANDCVKCIAAKGAGDVITRRARKTTHPKIHYGNIGSGNSLIKDGLERDELAQRDNVICFEMEAAGLMDDFPCLVIRGISDYADSHKNSSWQPYAAASAAAFAKQLVRTITPQDVDRLAPIQGHWSILSVDLDLPFARNLRFTGRQDVLSQIQEYFSGDATAPRTLLLYGIGGIGKTQIAAHYAHAIAKDSLAVCWADARDKHSVESGLTRIAQCVLRSLILHYGEQVAPTIFGFSDVTSLLSDDPVPPRTTQDAIRALKSWLRKKSNRGWLIVFDNYDNIEEFNIEEYFPNADHSRILITSRRPDLQRTVGKALDISGLDDGSALQLLLSGNTMYKAEDTPTSPSVRAVLRKLCNLPLAIVQANAYINNRRLAMNDFLQQYEQQFDRPMGQKPRGPWNYDHVVNTTWEVSLAAIQAEDILAAETLLTCSLLGNTAILPEMMQRCIPGIRDRRLYDSAWHAFSKGRLHKAERACRKLLLALENTETTEDLTGSFLKAQMLQAQIMAKHKDGCKSEYGYKLANNLVRQIVSSKFYKKDPQSLHHVPEYGQMLLSRGDTEGARIYCRNGIQLMMDTGAPKEMILYWLDQYCDLLFRLGYCSEVKPHLRWMLNESLDTTRKCDILGKLSILLMSQNEFGELELVARQLLDLERDNISKWGDSGRIIFPTVFLCTALFETGRGTEAAMVADESLRLHQKDVGAEDPNTVFLEDFLRELRNGRLPEVSYKSD
ncbi:ankyrin repeat-domain-containing protein 50 [Aspergillus terreus]|uniref:Ankyrin repeat-domain-containing protein 50 n=1 Tax=Aspergillus terreus TaxID=33178 RepID=A0A5M3Z7C9_ASPTE|nr:hypothetical protein ATETN484_0010054400 [Aspergillus terreus]GFF18591.1 ankyrin repeat-domain-containing protein 50 [Aspergillus terreus]